MTAGTYHVTAEQGATFNRTVTWTDANGTPVNVTGFTARMHVRESYGATAAVITLTTENGGITLGGALGTIALTITAAATAALAVPNTPGTPPEKAMVYDLELVNSGVVTRLLQGNFTVVREVTR